MILEGLSFAHPWALTGLAAAGGAGFLLRLRKQHSPRLQLPSSGDVRALPRSLWARLWWLPGALLIAALVLTSVGLAGPRLRGSRACL